jgi:antitoxin component YwqK of YwqJK toxin-antitoxin module
MNSPRVIKNLSFLIILFSLIFAACEKEEVPKSSLIIKDNLLYKRGSDIPFTGKEKALVENKIIEYDVKDGLKHGGFKLYFENGNIEMQGQVDSNRNVGKWLYYYPDGQIESEGYFNLNLPDGKWIWNYSDGKRKEEGVYNNGVRIGMWYQFDSSGTVTYEHDYKSGEANTDSSNI